MVIVFVSGLGLACLGACGATSDPQTSTTAATPSTPTTGANSAVVIHTFAFAPNPVRIRVGTTLTWTNDDDILHTVTSGTRTHPDGMFDQPLNGPRSTASFTFSRTGTFPYHCKIHPGMDATVEVVDAT